MSRACLDAGVISLYYLKDPPEKIIDLMTSVKDGQIVAIVPSIILVEVFKHLCIAGRKEYATSCIRSFELKVHPILIQLTSDLIIEAGLLKCQFRNTLSYNDSIAIAIALKEKATFHTTEKNLPKIHNLQIISYEF